MTEKGLFPQGDRTFTDTERLDFMEMYLARDGIIQTDNGSERVRTWQVVTAARGSLRETMDLLMGQKRKLQNG